MENKKNTNWDITLSLSGDVKPGTAEEYETVLMALQRKQGKTLDQAVKNVTGHDKILAQYFESINFKVKDKTVDKLADKFTEQELKDYIMTNNESIRDRTPDDIITLSEKLLDVKKGEDVIDMCCGSGNFAIDCAEKIPNASYSGYDIRTDRYLLAEIRRIVSGLDISFYQRNVFDLSENGDKADKIFADFPPRLNFRASGIANEYISHKAETIPFFSASASDWIFNMVIMDLLKKNGKAVALMPNGATFRMGVEEKVRALFVEEGYIETVISLPANMRYDMSIPLTLIVFSYGNKKIRMIDASKEYVRDGKKNRLVKSNIDKIYDAYVNGNELSVDASLSDIKENGYNLSVARYTENTPEIKNGRPLGDVAKQIIRGARLSAKEIGEIKSDLVTDYQYMELSNINDGMIDKDLSYIAPTDDKYDKFCIKDKDLVISKIAAQGSSMKVAVADNPEGHKIIAAGNVYIISVDQDKINPYYLKAYLESSAGVNAIRRVSTGSVIPSLSIQDLKNITVPVPPMEVQDKFVEDYRAELDAVSVLRQRLQKAEDKLHDMFDQSQEVM